MQRQQSVVFGQCSGESSPYCHDREVRARIDGPDLLLEPNAPQTIARRLVAGQFGGRNVEGWEANGLVVRLSLPVEHLTA